MHASDGKKLDCYSKPRVMAVLRGGKAGEPRTHAELELDRALRALFYAMEDKRGRMPNKAIRNVACGVTHPWRMLVKRFRDAKRARNPQHNYPLCKQTVREIDRYVDALFCRTGDAFTSGDNHPKAA